MIDLCNIATAGLCALLRICVQVLVDALEEERSDDQDYYIDAATIDVIAMAGRQITCCVCCAQRSETRKVSIFVGTAGRDTKLPERSGTFADDPFSGRQPTSHERLTGLPWDGSYHDGPAPWDIGQPQTGTHLHRRACACEVGPRIPPEALRYAPNAPLAWLPHRPRPSLRERPWDRGRSI